MKLVIAVAGLLLLAPLGGASVLVPKKGGVVMVWPKASGVCTVDFCNNFCDSNGYPRGGCTVDNATQRVIHEEDVTLIMYASAARSHPALKTFATTFATRMVTQEEHATRTIIVNADPSQLPAPKTSATTFATHMAIHEEHAARTRGKKLLANGWF
ncbi:hypothetical protein PWT90_09100 [Aphanocladium album]|nr:hypothetical protein PWT90_09100 [Aphanocladium album]